MTFAERLKDLRKQAGLSQEKLAEKLGVSRQAITKWETNAGIPDIENIMAISSLFGISLDELLSGEKPQIEKSEFLYESVTEYDIDRPKRYDLKLCGAKAVRLIGYDGEKLRIKLASKRYASIQSDVKAKIDDGRDRIDIDLSRKNGLSEAVAKDTIWIMISVPTKYIHHIELSVTAETIELADLKCEQIELDVKTSNLLIDRVVSTIEVNCDLDMKINCHSVSGSVELNQISATSEISVPHDFSFRGVVKGMGNSITYAKNGKTCDDFSSKDAENIIELNGMKSELVIVAESED